MRIVDNSYQMWQYFDFANLETLPLPSPPTRQGQYSVPKKPINS